MSEGVASSDAILAVSNTPCFTQCDAETKSSLSSLEFGSLSPNPKFQNSQIPFETPDLSSHFPAKRKADRHTPRFLLHERPLHEIDNRLRVFYPNDFTAHDTGSHQERAERLNVLIGRKGCLRRVEFADHLGFVPVSQLACIADLIRVHQADYLLHLDRYSQLSSSSSSLSSNNNDCQYTSPPYPTDHRYLDSDTIISPGSLLSAKQSAQCVILAVDEVMQSQSCPFALALCRPPGHHAGASGSAPSNGFWHRPEMGTNGFCLLNNVAIGAAYCRYHYPDLNIAIIDVDIHHGNGTEDIVANLNPRIITLPLPSSWSPVKQSVYKPWFDVDDSHHVLFASISLVHDDDFYPGSGTVGDVYDRSNIIHIPLTQLSVKKVTNKKQLIKLIKTASTEFETKINTILVPALLRFKPDVIFISLGADGHVDDKYHYLATSDYSFFCSTVRTTCQTSKIISVLEGGYSIAGVDGSAGVDITSLSLSLDQPLTTSSAAGQTAAHSEDGGLEKVVMSHLQALLQASV